MAVCSRDVVHWCNSWLWTDDPREPGAALPFDLFPRQVEFLTWLAERAAASENGLVEKSRDVGVTNLCCLYALHSWLFQPGFSAGFGSRKEEYVDQKGARKTIFEKFRFALEHLPRWMWPVGFNRRIHDSHMKLLNPQNGATITGEAGDEIGRGDRQTIYFVDEAASLTHPELVDAALSQTTRCRIDVSTPKGPGNPFWRKRFSGNVPVFTFHWRDDPRKNQAWYEAEKKKIDDPVIVAQELDIDYTASVEGICIPAAWVRAAINLPLPSSGRTLAGFDVAEGGANKNVLIPRCGPVAQMPVAWGQMNTTESAFKAADEAERCGVAVLVYDCVGVGAGIRGALTSGGRRLKFHPEPINTGSSPSDTHWPDGRTSKERFLNLRAELWWKLRCRFEKAFEHVMQGVAHRPEEMISIPNHPQLIAELSLPLYERRETGKVQIESKDRMRARGVKSPDYADALVLAMMDEPPAPRISLPPRPSTARNAPAGIFDRRPEGGF